MHDAAAALGQVSRRRPTKKSGGSGWEDANDDSGSAGRAPREEGAADTRVGATRTTAEGRKISRHSSRASDGSRPADDTGRRSEVPAGVGPIIKNRDRAEIIRMVGTRYSTLPQKKGSQQSSRWPEQAFILSENGSRRGARRGRGRGRRGTQGRGHGGNSKKGGGSSSAGDSSSASSASGSSHGGGSIPHGRCWRCNRRDHIREECTTKESDFLAKCARCSGFGHEKSTCSSDAAVLAMELLMSKEDLAVEAQAFVATRMQATKMGCCSNNGGAARIQPQQGTPRVPGVFDGEGATEAHRQVDAQQSRYPLSLPRPRTNCPLLQTRGSLQRGRARAGSGRQVKV